MSIFPLEVYAFNPASQLRSSEPLRVGVPFPKGILTDPDHVRILDGEGTQLPYQTKCLNYWPDGSIRWLLCDFVGTLVPKGETTFLLVEGSNEKTENRIQVQKDKGQWDITAGSCKYTLDTQIFRPFLSVVQNGRILTQSGEMILVDTDGRNLVPRITQMRLESLGPVCCSINIAGECEGGDVPVRFEAILDIFAVSDRVTLEVRLHNPKAAVHRDNLWDLGDAASVYFREWSLRFPLREETEGSFKISDENVDLVQNVKQEEGVLLAQYSSGGTHWDSPVHRNRTGLVEQQISGWELYHDCQKIDSGRRVQPVLHWQGATNLSGAVGHFWQRFPKALEGRDSGLCFGLFPASIAGEYELQGGEQVTERLYFDFSEKAHESSLGRPVILRCCQKAYIQAGVVPAGKSRIPNANLQLLLRRAINGDKDFMAKREMVDEYGWRNFGEIYADHEGAFWDKERPFVSHYNNQYDTLMSFYRQFFSAGDTIWGELASDLARHFCDIDINHTDEDREEYCHGPFWHTDHYLDAGLSSHRMASKEHLSQKNPAFCGGGPGAENCYISGLVTHYFHTGDSRAKDLVISLADWCWISLRGPQTLGATLLRFKKRLNKWNVERGSGVIASRFPFTRGTGNCLNATLDAFVVTGDESYFARAAKLVHGVVHPNDDPNARDLLNAEACWSYTVFLSALGRYLKVMEEYGQQDTNYIYARDSLLTYARWMVENEYLYLEKPEILEYPNETWSAQELRKSVVLYYASRYATGDEQSQFLARARYFWEEGLEQLAEADTSHYTRPLALVLQNCWLNEVLDAPPKELLGAKGEGEKFDKKGMAQISFGLILRHSLEDLAGVLHVTNPRREWRWLKARLGWG